MTSEREAIESPDAMHMSGVSHRVQGPLAVVHVSVVTMESRQLLTDHTVVIENGLIRALGPTAKVDIRDMRTVDGSNGYLMPGLSDMHTHVTHAGNCSLYLANGVTRLRNMDGKPWHLALSRMLENADMPGPRLFTTSPLIDGLGDESLTGYPGSIVLSEPIAARDLVSRLLRRGYREIKAYQWLDLDALRALGAAASEAHVRMAGHCPEGVSFEQSIEAGMGCFEHLTGIATGHLRDGRQFPLLRKTTTRQGSLESLELIAEHLDFDAIRRLASTMAERDIWNCPTLVVWQQQIQPLELALADPDLQYAHISAVRDWEAILRARFASLPCSADRWLSLGRRRDEALAKVVTILHEEGAPLLLGTDAPNPFVVHGPSIHRELANLVGAGLSPYEALRCGTVDAARFLGESSNAGSIAVGKRADLILLRSNPLMDVGAVREGLESVFVNGYYLARHELDALLGTQVRMRDPPPPRVSTLCDVGDLSDTRRALFRECISATEVGSGSYSHRQLPDDGWQVEERWARSGPRGPQRCTSQLWLGPDWTLLRARIKVQSDVGRELIEIAWSDDRYRVCVTQPDGYARESDIVSVPLVPSQRLAFSVLPAWCALQAPGVTTAALTIDQEVAKITALAATLLADDTTDAETGHPQTWQVRFTALGEVTIQKYRISANGALLALQDHVFGAPRELTAKQA
jgi:hypothetical protein